MTHRGIPLDMHHEVCVLSSFGKHQTPCLQIFELSSLHKGNRNTAFTSPQTLNRICHGLYTKDGKEITCEEKEPTFHAVYKTSRPKICASPSFSWLRGFSMAQNLLPKFIWGSSAASTTQKVPVRITLLQITNINSV